jgi:hypothetical protein
MLRQSYSPYKALKASGCMAYVEIDASGVQWEPCFHEGAGFAVRDFHPGHQSDVYQFTSMGYGERVENHSLYYSKDRPDFLKWILPDSSALTFGRVSSPLEQFVNHIVISGRYADSLGKVYDFSDSGSVNWAGKAMAYSISLDQFGTERDYVWVHLPKDTDMSQAGEVYAYTRTSGALLLYKGKVPDEGERITFDEALLMRLDKIL